MSTARRVLGDSLISATALLLLLIALICIDQRVREHVGDIVAGRAATSVAIEGAGQQALSVASAVFDAARDKSIEHAPMMIFALVAGVLVLFMLRT